jgi:hypothetical protein
MTMLKVQKVNGMAGRLFGSRLTNSDTDLCLECYLVLLHSQFSVDINSGTAPGPGNEQQANYFRRLSVNNHTLTITCEDYNEL